MADSSHLERMGRELKCPICLSLLNSAVSLTCNHVFCNSCIQKSMKSGLYCPLCKVPYHRREVRPAPHMDNLVTIYKGMEVDSGISIFVTQNVPSIKLSDGKKQVKGDDICGRQVAGAVNPQTNQRKSKEKKSSSSKLKLKNSGHKPAKPSLRTNKRVQVPQYPVPGTPVQQMRPEPKNNEAIGSMLKKSSAISSESPSFAGKGDPSFLPFFWLREEEDAEKLSQRTDEDHVNYTPENAPAFSDIKDSDDDIPFKSSLKEVHSKFAGADYFDSEMFEWTQRACSPDLFSSPVKTQVNATSEFDGMLERVLEAPPKGISMNDDCNLFRRNKNDYDQHGNKRLGKRGLKTGKRGQNKRAKKNVDKKSGKKFIQDQKCHREIGRSTSKFDCASESTTKDTCNISAEAKWPNEVDENACARCSVPCGRHGINENENSRMHIRTCEVITSCGKGYPKKAMKLKQNPSKPEMNEVVFSQNHGCEHTVQQISNFSFGRFNARDSNIMEKSSNSIRVCESQRLGREIRQPKKVKLSKNDVLMDRQVDDIEVVIEVTPKAETMNKVQLISDTGNLDGLLEREKALPQMDKEVLLKCKTSSTKAQCAFCHSMEETEASGEIVHYFKGRPVNADFDSGSNIIHSHKNCAEWAPNVYFEDDSAINLEAELARSRRIKCCLCGIKGAALGCYEKSCRKSFHVPCARMVQQCRWDSENFVMLCPLHSSSKLPSEMCGSQAKRRKCSMKGQSQPQQSEAVVKHNTSLNVWNSRGISDKLVVCCSALANAEKETVYEFARVSGAIMSKDWTPSVTHVITSTDENKACRRTLKVLMGILEGKWILSTQWVKACMKAEGLVKEAPYEISIDIHGIKDGPRLGRQRLLNKQPKLFAGLQFYFTEDFVPSYKGYLQGLIISAGGTIMRRKPIAQVQDVPSGLSVPPTIIIYSLELPEKCDPGKKDMVLKRRRSDAEALAKSTGSKVESNLWVLNCIAGYKLQDSP
ncbi:hypothetical protein Nepgr_003289 [Nepenthes gracilis]|uniref:Uncharacterized protein n=1 Tax=Nepenthes gracilis TaxID=150966 RepID=A0AAD3RZA9_NEPGR|nr:hypothetical protein Nepgr_003289 [Nepenthes gracilis]